MDQNNVTRKSTSLLAAVALAIGLVGASATACDLTQPSHFQQDSTRNADSTDRQASLDASSLEAYRGDLSVRLSGAPRG